MDIFDWIEDLSDELREAGQYRVVELINRIPHELHDNHPERVEAMLPEALAAARALQNPWLEVFFRHWGLQNRMRNLAEGEKALPEAVSLLEFAHRDETQQCPQSVCVTQDIAICYGNVDGPGWVPERLALSEETLARIEPSRNCYDCISREYALALMDGGRADEAVTYLQAQARNMLRDGGEPGVAYRETQAGALFRAGRCEQALAELEAIEEEELHDDDDGDRLSRATFRALILARLGRIDEAWDALPPYGPTVVPLLYPHWSEAVALIAAARPEHNHWRLGRLLATMVSHMDRVGAHRRCIELALRHGELALLRKAGWTARRALAIARRHLPSLRSDLGASELIAAFAARVDALDTAAAPRLPAEAVYEHVRDDEGSDPEQDIELLLAAYRERPDDGPLAGLLGSAMIACGAREDAIAHLWEFVRRHPQSEDAPASQLLEQWLEQGDAEAEIGRLAALVEPARPAFAHWCRAQLAFAHERWNEVGEHVERLLSHVPDANGARRLWARAAMANRDFDRAVGLYAALAEQSEEPGGDDWDLMSAASAAGDWPAVRRSAARLGMQLSSEDGPVRESWGWLRLRYEHDGESYDCLGRRTGPVTAEVVAVAAPGRPQHVRDEVVFDAAPLEQAPEDEAEREHWLTPFRVLHTRHRADYRSWYVDGAHPGESAFEAMREALEAQQWSVWVRSGDDYRVRDPKQDEYADLPGLYFFLATPPQVAPSQVDLRLLELTAGWEHPLSWLQLAEQAGADTDRHEAIVEAYGL
ncbi:MULTISPECIES: hypothetical protein [unclassified Lysobacter]|uniref:tetratricopeptide repeat protein n=1 Tax=unclassified Lysobacter TaxID=2635362 RepID=UPI001BE60BE7|nr:MULTISPECIES: hypothetical protein [unclassified Lysobacter]MBT2745329.1 hypothetical protein [Lysobacter sp. ISL-42]MBT2751926.1 hypothetical protein [Lysobacter sp. ISL-50]MBT2777891.1 hypothetical protein [Lysobacter sp. ISL-54]MBT2783147.1 hypothetical protein [Lysobacter sp. ISL-52]